LQPHENLAECQQLLTPSSARAANFHVAGHAIVAFRLGWKFESLQARHLGGLQDPWLRIEDTASYRVAGAVAEAKFLRTGAWKIFREEIGLGADGELGDLDYLAEAMNLPSCDLTRSFMHNHFLRVERMLRPYWPDLCCLVERLSQPSLPTAP
jgi:hypothetical protein